MIHVARKALFATLRLGRNTGLPDNIHARDVITAFPQIAVRIKSKCETPQQVIMTSIKNKKIK
jgi:hypothetical protein